MPHSIVVTGFSAFPGVPDNPSQRIVEHLATQSSLLPENATTRVIEVAYGAIHPTLDAILAQPPAALLLTGYSAQATGLTLETRASTLCDPQRPDKAAFAPEPGNLPPASRDNRSLDFEVLEAALDRHGLPWTRSLDAGQYLCNFTYYAALERIERQRLSTRVLFLHLPAIEGTALAQQSEATMPHARMVQGVALIARHMADC